jgi:hypothetical protein
MLSTGIGSIITAGLIDAFGVKPALVAVSLFLPVVTLLSWPALRTAEAAAVVPTEKLESLDAVAMFTGLSLVAKERLASSLEPVDVAARDIVIREGDVGDRFYIVVAGEFDVSVRGEPVDVRGPSDYFGEIALLRDVPRTATVKARSDARLYALDRNDFLETLTNHAAGARRSRNRYRGAARCPLCAVIPRGKGGGGAVGPALRTADPSLGLLKVDRPERSQPPEPVRR